MAARSHPRENPDLILSTIRTAERLGAGTAEDADNAVGDLRAQISALRAHASGYDQPPEWERVVREAETRLSAASTPDSVRDISRRLAQDLQTMV